MGFKEWFGFGGSAAAEAPQDAEEPQVEQESPEAASKRLAAEEAAEAEGPELKVVEAEEEPKVSEASRAELWSDMTEANTQRANDLFDKANKYFRDKKKETGSGKWDKADPRYLSWQAGVAQISASELLGKHAVRLEELQAQKESLDKISLTASERKKKGGSFEESMEAIDQLAKVNAELALEQAIVEQLDTAYQEQELDIARMEFDIVAQVENDAAKKAEQAGYAAAIDKAKEAYNTVDSLIDELTEMKKGFLSSFRNIMEITNLKKRIKEAEAAAEELGSLARDAGAVNKPKGGGSARVANMRFRNEQSARNSANIGRGTMVG